MGSSAYTQTMFQYAGRWQQFLADISTGEQPSPISAIAAITIHGALASEKRKAPAPPKMESMIDAVRLGPKRSSQMPTANCASAKVANHAPDATDRSTLVMPSSVVSAGVSTAMKER